MEGQAKLDSSIFRQYDIRGIIGKTLTSQVMRLIGQAYGTYIQRMEGKRVVIGRDVRPSSQEFVDAAIEGLLTSGCTVIDIGVVPSSLLYYAMREVQVDGGFMVTASHNPPQYNGVKLRRGENPFAPEEITALYNMIDSGDLEQGMGSRYYANVVSSYVELVSKKVELGSRALTVVIDPGNGTNGPIVSKILDRLEVSYHCIFCEPDGRFPNHHPDPSKPENLKDLQKKVREFNADIGFAYDGDGDRLGVVAEDGSIVHPDQYLALLAQTLFRNGVGFAVLDVRSSQTLIDQIEQLGAEVILSEAGYPNILRHMRQAGAELGGESTGHVYFNDPTINFDDAILASLKLLEYLSKASRPLSEIVKSMPSSYTTPEIRIELSVGRKAQVVQEAAQAFQAQGYDAIDIDGVRVKFPDGWALIRPSNTEEVLSLRFEGRTEEALARIIEKVRVNLQKSGVELEYLLL